ncbi:MAG TPA: DUF3015 family protein [Anaeromyxobacteraceae bacterium]|nr:DUF3015 family protein [Anaeromyxobacteraceae bacterium]
MRASRIVLVAVMLAGAATVSAQGTAERTRQAAATGKSTYGAAGCGLGSLVFGDQPGGVQILAATTNGTVGSQTFGITFGTSNCGNAVVGGAGARTFIEANREMLAKDAARGSGETISTLSHLAGCADASKVGAALQQSYEANFSEASSEAVAEHVISTLQSDASLACGALM